jgi:hypothetical protein
VKLVHVETVVSIGKFAESTEWNTIKSEVADAIRQMVWPPGSTKFTIHPQSGKKRNEGNGVVPIKHGLMEALLRKGWKTEVPLNISTVSRPGRLDAVVQTRYGPLALEWETGNISSSHRALNKMALGLLKGVLAGGMLVVPTRALYQYLTDRVGNWSELQPYLDLWKAIPYTAGILEILVVEHDDTSESVPCIPKITAGRALE